MRLNTYQRYILRSMKYNDEVLVNACRQSGKSLVCRSYITQLVDEEQRDLNILLVVPNIQIKNNAIIELIHALRHLDVNVIQHNLEYLIVDDLYGYEKVITIVSANEYNKLVGYTPDVLIIDEMAFCNDRDIGKLWYMIRPIMIENNSKILLISTNKPESLFDDIWKTDEFVKIAVNWWDVFDDDWYETVIERGGIVTLDGEYIVK